jgi:hypothetical protein
VSKVSNRKVSARVADNLTCGCCGKHKAKRLGKSPAPIQLVAGTVRMALCMKCAKLISSALDVAIERIESDYRETPSVRIKRSVCRKTQGKAEPGNTCLQTPGTCESCPDWARK